MLYKLLLENTPEHFTLLLFLTRHLCHFALYVFQYRNSRNPMVINLFVHCYGFVTCQINQWSTIPANFVAWAECAMFSSQLQNAFGKKKKISDTPTYVKYFWTTPFPFPFQIMVFLSLFTYSSIWFTWKHTEIVQVPQPPLYSRLSYFTFIFTLLPISQNKKQVSHYFNLSNNKSR